MGRSRGCGGIRQGQLEMTLQRSLPPYIPEGEGQALKRAVSHLLPHWSASTAWISWQSTVHVLDGGLQEVAKTGWVLGVIP